MPSAPSPKGDEFSANIRMRDVESLKEAGSRGAGLRILIGKRAGSAYTSDLSPDGIGLMVRSAIELAAITTEDPHQGMPDAEEMGSIAGDLKMYSDDVAALETPLKIEMARRAEEAALSADPRITNSEGASFDSHLGRHVFANSRGFAGRIPHQLLLAEHGAGGARGRIDGARLLVLDGAQFRRSGKAGGHRPHRRRARVAPAGRAQGGDAERARGVRTAHRALPARSYFRSRARRLGLPARIVSGREAGRESGVGEPDRDRRRHHPRPVRLLAVRRRRRALAAHAGDRARRPEELPAEHIHGAQTGFEDHRQRVPRAGRQCRHRARELFRGKGRQISGGDYRRRFRMVSMSRS